MQRLLKSMRAYRQLIQRRISCRGNAERVPLRKRFEREHVFFETALQHLPAGVLIVEAPSGCLLFHNRQVMEILHCLDPQSGLPSNFRDFCFGLDGPLARAIAWGEVTIGEEVEIERDDGMRAVVTMDVGPIRDAAGRIVAGVAVFQDVTERRAAEKRVEHLALHDPLTGLPNRVLLLDRLGQALTRARRESDQVAVMLLDLDGFKDINDTLGHPAGDQLLHAVAWRIASTIRTSDTLARLGGDEFALVQSGVRQAMDDVFLAEKVLGTLTAPFELNGQEVHVAASLGIALFPRDGQDPDTLLKNADLALYQAKAEGRGRFCFFEPAMDMVAQARRRLDRELRQGLQRGEFVLHYQPQLELVTGRFTGAEALVRWKHPERGLVMPDEFIPMAEASGLIGSLGDWVLREACRQAKAWRERGWPLTVAVNLSPAQLRNRHLLPAIGEALARAGLEPTKLELEITESVLMETFAEDVAGFLRGLTTDGVRLAIDDFGVGYSSLAYLKHLPVQTIKIDRTFVSGIGEDAEGEALVRTIVALGHSLGKRVVAEGVESEAQLAFLRRLGCDAAQGFLLGRPQPPAAVERLLARKTAALEAELARLASAITLLAFMGQALDGLLPWV